MSDKGLIEVIEDLLEGNSINEMDAVNKKYEPGATQGMSTDHTFKQVNKDHRSSMVEPDKGAHDQAGDTHGDTSGKMDTSASDASSKVEADKANHDQGKDTHGDTSSNKELKTHASDASASMEVSVSSHDQEKDAMMKEEEEIEEKKKMLKSDKEVNITITDKDGDGKDDSKEDDKGTEKDFPPKKDDSSDDDEGSDDGEEKKGKVPPQFAKEAKDDMSKDQKKLDVDKDGEIEGSDLAKLRKEEKDMDDDEDMDKDDMEEDHPLAGAKMDNDKELPDADKHTLKMAASGDKSSATAEPNKGSHDQGTDKMADASGDEGLKGHMAMPDVTMGKMSPHDQGMDEAKDTEEVPPMGDKDENEDEDSMDEMKMGQPNVKSHDQGKDKIKEADMDDEDEDEKDLDEDFKAKAKIIFETAVNEKTKTIREEVEAEFDSKLSEETAGMNEKVSEYVDYAVKEWLEENSLEIKYSLRTEIAEGFIGGLRKLFVENYIDIPEETVDVVDELTETVESQKDQLVETGDKIETLQKELLALKKDSVVSKLSEDLVDTQKVRLSELSESIEASDIEEFEDKLSVVKETYFSGESSNESVFGSMSEEVEGSVALVDGEGYISEDANFTGTDANVAMYANWLSSNSN